MKLINTLILVCLLASICAGQNIVNMTKEYKIYGIPQSGYGSGTSFVDFDQDGDDDITMGSLDGGPLQCLRNDGDKFTNIFIHNNTEEQRQMIWVDFDNDKDLDLQITSKNKVRLFENPGDFNLIEITDQCGIVTEPGDKDGVSYPSCWTDYDKDGYLDVLLTFRSLDTLKSIRLYRNNGNKTFTDVSEQVGISDTLGSTPLAACFNDFNNDNYEDILIAQNYDEGNILLINDQNGKFLDVSQSSTIGGGQLALDAMSTTTGDLDHDGLMDIYITNIGSDAFFYNIGNNEFLSRGNYINLDISTFTFGASFFDLECDTDLDLYATRYGVMENKIASTTFFKKTEDVVFGDPESPQASVAIGDFNGDGYPDIVGNSDDDIILYQNNTQSNNWITIKAYGTTSNYFAVGTRLILEVEGKKIIRHIQCGQDFCSQQSYTQFFGLAQSQVAEKLTIIWPSGLQEEYIDLQANTKYVFEEGNGYNAPLSFTGYTDVSLCTYGNPTIISAQGLDPPFDYTVYNDQNELVTQGQLENQFQKDTIFLENGSHSIALSDNLDSQFIKQFFACKKEYVPSFNFISLEAKDKFDCEGTKTKIDLELETGPNLRRINWTPNQEETWSYSYNNGIVKYTNFEVEFGDYELELINNCDTAYFNIVIEQPSEEELLGTDLEINNPTSLTAQDGSVYADCTFGTPPYTYKWIDIDLDQIISTQQSIDMVGAGAYLVRVTDSENCLKIVPFDLEATSSINDFFSSDFTLSPNPTEDVIHINLTGDKQIIKEVAIYNTQLQQVETHQDFNTSKTLDVSTFRPGLYFLEIRDGAQRSVKKFVVQ